jgi:hypothetical protein
MSAVIYERVIAEWCNATGMTPWAADAHMHVELEGTTVGLVFAEDVNPQVLNVYFDLGTMDFPDMNQFLLLMNIPVDTPGGGCYALHPETGSVVYRMGLELNDALDGASLPEMLYQCLLQSRARLHA